MYALLSQPLLVLVLVLVLVVNEQCHVKSFQQRSILQPFIHGKNNHKNIIIGDPTYKKDDTVKHRIETKLNGIDFDGIGNEEECDFTDGDLSQIDLTKCLPFPNPNVIAEEVVTLCMDALLYNDEPKPNAGLEVCFNFSSDRCRAANGPTFEDFVHFAGNPIFRLMVNAREYKVLSIGPEMNAGQGSVTSVGLGVTRGAMKTVLISVTPNNVDLKERRFLWTLQKERRPPRQGCWLVHECIAVENSFAMTL